MTLGIGIEPEARFADGAFLADAGDDIGKRPPLGHVIMNVIEGDERCAVLACAIGEPGETLLLIALMKMDGAEEDALRGCFHKLCKMRKEGRVELGGRQGDQHLPFARGPDLGESDMALGLLCPPVAFRQQTAEAAIGIAVGRISEHFETVGRHQSDARQIFDLAFAGLVIGAHHAGEAVAVGDANGGKTELIGTRDHFLRMRSPAQEGEIGGDGELGVLHHSASREEAMDNLLLTQGWRRYAWPVMTADPAISYIPEYNGHLAEGRVVDPVTGKALTGKEVYLSVPSRRTQVSVTTSNNDGKLKFELRNFYGSSEIILQTNLNTDTTSRIEMTDPFSTQYGRWRLPEYKGNFRNSEAMLYRGIYEQAQRVYHHAAYSRFVSEYADTNTFYFVPDEKYMLDDFTRFQTMEEVIREYVVSTNVLLKRNKFQLYLADRPHESFFTDPPLILIDGVPYFDANELFAQDPKKIRRLDLVNREYNLGAQTYYGIISLTTYQGDLQGVQLDPHTTVLDYPGIPDQREFFSPVYETELQVNSRKPDFRTLLFWVPQIQAKADQPIPISFYSSDVPGKYAVVVQGLSGNGLPLTKVSYFEVKK